MFCLHLAALSPGGTPFSCVQSCFPCLRRLLAQSRRGSRVILPADSEDDASEEEEAPVARKRGRPAGKPLVKAPTGGRKAASAPALDVSDEEEAELGGRAGRASGGAGADDAGGDDAAPGEASAHVKFKVTPKGEEAFRRLDNTVGPASHVVDSFSYQWGHVYLVALKAIG